MVAKELWVLFVAGATYPLWTAARHPVLVRTLKVKTAKKKKKQAAPKQTLYTAEYPTNFSQFSPALSLAHISM